MYHHKRFNSHTSTLTPSSQLEISDAERPDSDRHQLDDSTAINRDENVNSLSFEFGSEDLGLSLKSIFPATCHLTASGKKKHRRVLSHPVGLFPTNLFNCKKSISKKTKLHIENLMLPADCDSKQIIISEIDDLEYTEFNASKLKTDIITSEMTTKNPKESTMDRKNEEKSPEGLPVVGFLPCTLFCNKCQLDVHTTVEIQNRTAFPISILEALSSLVECCRGAMWINQMRYHRCSNCNSILARST
ncbi:unnamed protein product [Blepharisma stoltei]|uniref:LITAF domain-containing protein n=1 Tax=Blepharisma stoltei TaxID=1481888 RepID=A0AAU9JPG6_9CILI|nr:unnamed protein product [Blepharisma stoltei]